jgi:fused signal recognition particle receptor
MLLDPKPKDAAPGDSNDQPGRGWLGRLRGALQRTRGTLVEGIGELFAGDRVVDEALVEEVETLLLSADVGVEATARLVDGLARRLRHKELSDGQAVFRALREDMLSVLGPVQAPLEVPADGVRPFVVLVVGVNGSGKTTTIGKLAHRLGRDGHSVMLAAGDTFRAAAVEQLQAWGERAGVAVVAQHTGADSASVIFDALASAGAKGVEVLIADTAGRLHTQSGLMEELKKVRRVLGKLDPDAPHETLLVLDGGTGQNALSQARQFHDAVGVSGIALTKLDGTAKGGVVLAIAERLGLPIRFIGVGEGVEDLRPFVAEEFVDALLGR